MLTRPEIADEDAARFEPVAEALASGDPIDWDSLDTPDLSASHRAVLRGLRAVADIVEAHKRLSHESDEVEPNASSPDAGLRTWGPLIVREYLGRGSFGDVYRAWDPRLDREVALKLLTPLAPDDAGLGSDVIAEGRALARVRHPNVVTVYGADRIGGRIGVWMEFVEGRTLAQRIAADGPLRASEATGIAADLARALAAVHRAGLLHRDVKAQNVMCEAGGRIVLTDFGTAMPHEDAPPAGEISGEISGEGGSGETPASPAVPRTVALAGTPLYLAPEVLAGAAPSVASDVYALGVLLYHLVTGRFPVTGRTLREIRERHRAGRRTPLTDARGDLPAGLVEVVERALAVDPAARYETAETMAAALDAVVRPAGVPADSGAHDSGGVTVSRPTPSWGAVRTTRHRTMAAVAAVLAIAAVGIGAWRWRAASSGLGVGSTPGTRDLVLVAAFDDATNDADLARVVESAVAAAITRSRTLALVPRDRVQKVLPFMRRRSDATLDAATSREVAARDGGIRAVVTGSITQAGTKRLLEARVVAPSSGNVLTTVTESMASRDEAIHAGEVLATSLAGALEARLAELPEPIAQFERVTTSSFEALRAYTEGRAAFEGRSFRSGNVDVRSGQVDAAPAFQRAIALDPSFALAHTWLGWSLQRTPAAIEHFARGDELAGTASAEEQLWAQGSHLWAQGQQPGALDARRAAQDRFARLLDLDPLHYWALNNIELFSLYRSGSFLPVVEGWVRQANARPRDHPTVYRAARALMGYGGSADKADGYVAQLGPLLESEPDSLWAAEARSFVLLAPAWDLWARGDIRQASSRLATICDTPEEPPVALLTIRNKCGLLAIGLGRLQQAQRHFAHPKNAGFESLVAEARGDMDTVRALYRSQVSRWDGVPLRVWLGLQVGVLDRGGDRGDAPLDFTPDLKLRHFAELAGTPSQELLQYFAEHWRMYPRPADALLRLAVVYAGALERVGDSDRARLVLRSATGDRRATWDVRSVPAWITARHAYAELLRRMGRPDEAEPVERELLALLSEADADHHIAAQLRARYGGTAPVPTGAP